MHLLNYIASQMSCIATTALTLALTPLLLIWPASSIVAQGKPQAISSQNLTRLVSVRRVDFADLDGEYEVGWFAADKHASEFMILDQDMKVHRVSDAEVVRELHLVEKSPDEVIAVLDAMYLGSVPVVLYRREQNAYINQHQLDQAEEYLALFGDSERDEIIIEAIDSERRLVFLRYQMSSDGETITFDSWVAVPTQDASAPAVRVGRVPFPYVIVSSLRDGSLTVYEYSNKDRAFAVDRYALDGGPAVAGALNGNQFAWIDPRSERLNLLDLASGENRVVVDLGGQYAQFMLLTHDASAIIMVNVDFTPHVYAWDTFSGQRFDLGPYRECQRIPDMVRLSEDGASLIIGCDSGLDIWRIGQKR